MKAVPVALESELQAGLKRSESAKRSVGQGTGLVVNKPEPFVKPK